MRFGLPIANGLGFSRHRFRSRVPARPASADAPPMDYGDHAAMRSARLLGGTLSNPELAAEMTGLTELCAGRGCGRHSRCRGAGAAPRRAALASLVEDAVITNMQIPAGGPRRNTRFHNSRLRIGAFIDSTAVFSLLKSPIEG
jgi:hypothetical protein